MARTPAGLPDGTRVTDFISLGVIAKAFPRSKVQEALLAATGKTSQRQRALPAHVVVYYAVALALYMQVSTREVLRCLLEGIQWLMGLATSPGRGKVRHFPSALARGLGAGEASAR